MNCNELAELSPLYLAGELDAARAVVFRAHLGACAACAAQIEQQKHIDSLLSEGVLAEPIDTSAVDLRIRQSIHAEQQAKVESHPQPRLSLRWIPAAAAVIAFALIAGFSYWQWFGASVAPVYEAVVHDHQVEVVEGARRTWIFDPAAIRQTAIRQGISENALAALAPSNYRLERAKLCPLAGNVYLHLVYTDGAHELSVFLHQGEVGPLPGAAREATNGKVLHAAHVGQAYLAGFQTGRFMAMVVTDQSAPAALDAARSLARIL